MTEGRSGNSLLLVRQISTLNETPSRTDFFGDEFGSEPRNSPPPMNSQHRPWIKPAIQVVTADWPAWHTEVQDQPFEGIVARNFLPETSDQFMDLRAKWPEVYCWSCNILEIKGFQQASFLKRCTSRIWIIFFYQRRLKDQKWIFHYEFFLVLIWDIIFLYILLGDFKLTGTICHLVFVQVVFKDGRRTCFLAKHDLVCECRPPGLIE